MQMLSVTYVSCVCILRTATTKTVTLTIERLEREIKVLHDRITVLCTWNENDMNGELY